MPAKEMYISWDASRSKYRVELRLSKNKSVSRRVATIEEARALRDEWLKLRGAGSSSPGAATPLDTQPPPSPPQSPQPQPQPQPQPPSGWTTSSDEDEPKHERKLPAGSIKVKYLKGAPESKQHLFTVKFD